MAGDGLYSADDSRPVQRRARRISCAGNRRIFPGATSTFPTPAPARECLVRFGESVATGNFPSYRIWMTQASFNAWDQRHNLNNTLNDITFVLGHHRVIYNGGATYAGSPYIGPSFDTPTGGAAATRWRSRRTTRSRRQRAGALLAGRTWQREHGDQEQMAY